MSQPWINNIPEVDWHGGNGSIQINGEPAANRYTEARLSKSTEEGLLYNIKKHNVNMKLNFSEDEEWPEVFPAIYPRLMVNGCQGIGSTIANVWLPHALDDLARSILNYLDTGTIDYDDIAPSFPTGGIIINQKDLPAIYKTGKGRVVLRGKVEIKDNYIYITEVPYQVYVEPFITSIKNLIIKGELTGISNILNKSSKNKLLIEIECEDAPLHVLNQLYTKTDLQKTYNANQYALVGKTPKFLTYKEYLDIFLNHNYECIKKEYTYDLEKSQKRLEIVKGLIKALVHIDDIIILIKKSESSKDAVDKLKVVYEFTQMQAEAIVNMKLGRLAKLESIELNKEEEDLTSTIVLCNEIITSVQKQKEIFIERFKAFVKKYPNPRKTQLTHIDPPKKEDKEIVEVEPEKCVVVLTKAGTIKRIPTASFKTQKRGGKGIKTQSDITSCVLRTNTIDSLMIFSTKGQMYRLLVNDIPAGTNSSAGVNVKSLVAMAADEDLATIYSIYRDTEAKYVLFVSKKGYVKKTPLDEYIKTKKKGGIIATSLYEGDELAKVSLINDEQIMLITNTGMAIRFKSDEIPSCSRAAKGVKGINLKNDEYIAVALPIRHETDMLAVFAENGSGKKVALSEFPIQKRAGRGIACYKSSNISGELAAATLISDEDSILISGDKTSICISAQDIPELGRTCVGNQIIKGSRITSITKV